MRRLTLILTLAVVCLAGVVVIPSASAGNFDAELMHCVGEDPATCPTATVGQSYSLTIYLLPRDGGRGEDFNCGTYHVTSGEFPPGLSITDEGLITGTPTRAGSFSFFLTVRYDKMSSCPFKNPSDDSFIIKVNPGAPTVAVTTASLPDANVNQPYTAPALTATGATVNSWTLAGGTLPAGVTLGTNGVISGTPTQSGTFTFTAQANANGASATKQRTRFVLAPLAVRTLTGQAPPATGLTAKTLVNAPLATGVTAVGGRPPYTFTAEGALPPGVTLDSATGKITGAGTTAGRYPFTVTVTDATGTKASVEWNVTVLPLLDFRKGKGLPIGRVNKRYSARIPVSGKESSTAEFAIAGKIPPGLELDDTGRLTGTLLKTGRYKIRVYAFSENGAPISKVFTIRVRA
jgi:large repetitive protein